MNIIALWQQNWRFQKTQKLSDFKLVIVIILTYGHDDSWVMAAVKFKKP